MRSKAISFGFATALTQAASASIPSYTPSELGWRTDFGNVYMRGKLIGAGSFGQVHIGIHQESGLEVAIKTLPKLRGKLTREKTLEKISRETDMLERLQGCKGVIRLLECFEDENTVQIVTELCPGGDLQKFVETYGPLDEASLARVCLEVLMIVKSCHDIGILHGDVKPANFCLKEARRNFFSSGAKASSNLRAIDFGCSQFLGSRRLSKRTGTPVFMAPEIFARDYGEKADVWGVGVMAYWLFCKRFPFFENVDVVKQARLEEVADAVSNNAISYSFGPWPNMSPAGLDFVQRCLTRREQDRIGVEEALNHSWFDEFISPAERQQMARMRLGAGAAPSAAAA